MRKASAGLFGGGIVVAIAGFVLRALWEPEPPFRGVEKLPETRRSAAERYIEVNPPKRSPITFDQFKERLMKPWETRKPGMFGVVEMSYSDGSDVLYIFYPDNRQDVNLEVLPDGSWRKFDVAGKTALIGRLFQND